MTPEAQRIAIAEKCGWRTQPGSQGKCWEQTDCLEDGWFYASELPDYLNDLNATHEAEKALTADDAETGSHWRFIQELIYVTKAESMEMHREVFVVAHATAAQRAEAFLRTLNLWKD